MSDENLIDPNEELDYFVGMKLNEAENLLVDTDVLYRIVVPGTISDFGKIEYAAIRVNLITNENHIVIKAYYG